MGYKFRWRRIYSWEINMLEGWLTLKCFLTNSSFSLTFSFCFFSLGLQSKGLFSLGYLQMSLEALPKLRVFSQWPLLEREPWLTSLTISPRRNPLETMWSFLCWNHGPEVGWGNNLVAGNVSSSVLFSLFHLGIT